MQTCVCVCEFVCVFWFTYKMCGCKHACVWVCVCFGSLIQCLCVCACSSLFPKKLSIAPMPHSSITLLCVTFVKPWKRVTNPVPIPPQYGLRMCWEGKRYPKPSPALVFVCLGTPCWQRDKQWVERQAEHCPGRSIPAFRFMWVLVPANTMPYGLCLLTRAFTAERVLCKAQ